MTDRLDARPTDRDRLPPGQILTTKWPVLHYSHVPRIDTASWIGSSKSVSVSLLTGKGSGGDAQGMNAAVRAVGRAVVARVEKRWGPPEIPGRGTVLDAEGRPTTDAKAALAAAGLGSFFAGTVGTIIIVIFAFRAFGGLPKSDAGGTQGRYDNRAHAVFSYIF